ncbi:MAG: nucleotide exchange factor GrpE [Saprospiraceae bacterium]
MANKENNPADNQKDKMKDKNEELNTAAEELIDNESVESESSEGADSRIAELEEQVQEQKDKYLRLFAEFENYKKRTIKEKLDMLKNASQDTLSSLLPVLDDFDRAKKVADQEGSKENFPEGIQLVYNKLYSIMANKGLTPMDSTGQDFDPEFHEAFTEIPAPSEDMKGKVIDTIEKGYFLNEKIIRHAKVVVGK